MQLALITAEKIVEMFLIILVGITAVKIGMVNKESINHLCSILLDIVTPCIILMGFQQEYDAALLRRILLAVVLSAVSLVLGILAARVLVRKKGNPDAQVETIAAVYPNCGFIGIPLATAVLGDQVVVFITAYIVMFNLFIWSHGVLVMAGKTENLKETFKNLLHPSMVAVVITLVLFLNNILLPDVLTNPMTMIANMNTPLAMMVAGMMLAQSNLLHGLKRARVYLILALKLLVMPLLTLAVLFFVKTDLEVAISVLIAAACPASTTGALFALRYNKDANYASELFAISTVACLVTTPLIVLAAGLVL